MTVDLKKRMIKKGRVILTTPLDFLFNYTFSIAFAAFSLVMLITGLKFGNVDPSPGRMTNKETLIFVGVIWVFVIASYLMQRVGLKFEKETVNLEKDEIFRVIHDVGEEFQWHIVSESEDYIVGDSTRILFASNRITILVDSTDVYINARTTGPEISFFRQGKLTDAFRMALRRRLHEIQHQKEIR
jgi:hypothetical protein